MFVATVLLAAAAVAVPPTQLLPGIPDNAQVVVAVDASVLRAHPLVGDWLMKHQARWSGADNDGRQFLTEAGLDPVRDVDCTVVALVPEHHGLALIAGRFDKASLEAALVKRGATGLTVAGKQLLRIPSRHNGADVLVYVNGGIVTVGDESAVTASLTGSRPGAPAIVQQAVATGALKPANPFWVVANVPDEMRRKVTTEAEQHASDDSMMHEVMLAGGAVRSVIVQGSLDDALHLAAVATADTADNAELLRDAAKGALAAVRLHFQDSAPDLVNVVRAIKVGVDGTRVEVAGAVPVALLERLLAQHGEDTGSRPTI
jgi:hypothetical protein